MPVHSPFVSCKTFNEQICHFIVSKIRRYSANCRVSTVNIALTAKGDINVIACHNITAKSAINVSELNMSVTGFAFPVLLNFEIDIVNVFRLFNMQVMFTAIQTHASTGTVRSLQIVINVRVLVDKLDKTVRTASVQLLSQ